MRYLRKVKSLAYYLKHVKHSFTHVLIGLVYAWILREIWQQFSLGYIILAAFGSLVIDVDHLVYFFTYGRHEWYAKEMRKLLRQGQFRNFIVTANTNHKFNTGLATHNVYFFGFFFSLSALSFKIDSKVGVILFGSIVLHLLFDIIDDLWVLGHVNENWKRFRRIKNGGDIRKLFRGPVLKPLPYRQRKV